jgi:hypothetical protein
MPRRMPAPGSGGRGFAPRENERHRRLGPVALRFCMVADGGLVSALPVWLYARPKRKSDRRPDEARRDLVVRGSGSSVTRPLTASVQAPKRGLATSATLASGRSSPALVAARVSRAAPEAWLPLSDASSAIPVENVVAVWLLCGPSRRAGARHLVGARGPAPRADLTGAAPLGIARSERPVGGHRRCECEHPGYPRRPRRVAWGDAHSSERTKKRDAVPGTRSSRFSVRQARRNRDWGGAGLGWAERWA